MIIKKVGQTIVAYNLRIVTLQKIHLLKIPAYGPQINNQWYSVNLCSADYPYMIIYSPVRNSCIEKGNITGFPLLRFFCGSFVCSHLGIIVKQDFKVSCSAVIDVCIRSVNFFISPGICNDVLIQ